MATFNWRYSAGKNWDRRKETTERWVCLDNILALIVIRFRMECRSWVMNKGGLVCYSSRGHKEVLWLSDWITNYWWCWTSFHVLILYTHRYTCVLCHSFIIHQRRYHSEGGRDIEIQVPDLLKGEVNTHKKYYGGTAPWLLEDFKPWLWLLWTGFALRNLDKRTHFSLKHLI